MTRFVRIASLRRGQIEPGEVLEELDQALALARLEHDEGGGLGEIVVWQAGRPLVTSAGEIPSLAQRMPRISAELRTSLRGAPVGVADDGDVAYHKRKREAKALLP